ncbi:MAG TPA: hypothetical protein VFZ10_16150 [Geminicoccaceae bacterium]
MRFARRILPFDEQVARTWGEMTTALPKGTAVSNMDSSIARRRSTTASSWSLECRRHAPLRKAGG